MNEAAARRGPGFVLAVITKVSVGFSFELLDDSRDDVEDLLLLTSGEFLNFLE